MTRAPVSASGGFVAGLDQGLHAIRAQNALEEAQLRRKLEEKQIDIQADLAQKRIEQDDRELKLREDVFKRQQDDIDRQRELEQNEALFQQQVAQYATGTQLQQGPPQPGTLEDIIGQMSQLRLSPNQFAQYAALLSGAQAEARALEQNRQKLQELHVSAIEARMNGDEPLAEALDVAKQSLVLKMQGLGDGAIGVFFRMQQAQQEQQQQQAIAQQQFQKLAAIIPQLQQRAAQGDQAAIDYLQSIEEAQIENATGLKIGAARRQRTGPYQDELQRRAEESLIEALEARGELERARTRLAEASPGELRALEQKAAIKEQQARKQYKLAGAEYPGDSALPIPTKADEQARSIEALLPYFRSLGAELQQVNREIEQVRSGGR